MSTTDSTPTAPARDDRSQRDPNRYVEREVCEAFRHEQREANTRTWQELRSLRRVVIVLVVGGHLFAGGVNVAGFGYWIDRHAAQPHASTLRMIAEARTETREELRDLRREVHSLLVSVLSVRTPLGEETRNQTEPAEPQKGDRPCPAPP